MRLEECVLLMKCRLDSDDVVNTSGHLSLKVGEILLV